MTTRSSSSSSSNINTDPMLSMLVNDTYNNINNNINNNHNNNSTSQLPAATHRVSDPPPSSTRLRIYSSNNSTIESASSPSNLVELEVKGFTPDYAKRVLDLLDLIIKEQLFQLRDRGYLSANIASNTNTNVNTNESRHATAAAAAAAPAVAAVTHVSDVGGGIVLQSNSCNSANNSRSNSKDISNVDSIGDLLSFDDPSTTTAPSTRTGSASSSTITAPTCINPNSSAAAAAAAAPVADINPFSGEQIIPVPESEQLREIREARWGEGSVPFHEKLAAMKLREGKEAAGAAVEGEEDGDDLLRAQEEAENSGGVSNAQLWKDVISETHQAAAAVAKEEEEEEEANGPSVVQPAQQQHQEGEEVLCGKSTSKFMSLLGESAAEVARKVTTISAALPTTTTTGSPAVDENLDMEELD
mmetsp:Transcript_29305/g.49352  ORF Transcript_29305/g.49352 Transcript_29305/m.49352 type:complete len:416 (-) Transcript_29305:245-1492(-)